MTAGRTRQSFGRALARARRPDKSDMAVLQARMPFWFGFALLFGFATLQIVLNPFGFSDLTQRYTQDVSQLLISGPFLYPTTGRNQVSVALIDDAALRNLQMPWPWTYGTHARVLDTILAYKPRAVVVDFLFVDPRKDDTLGELVSEIGRYKTAGIPIYFEGTPSAQPSDPGLRKELAATGVSILDPTILVNQGVARQYPVTGRCFRATPPQPICGSLAVTVYEDTYRARPKIPTDGLIEIVWGTRGDPSNKWMRAIDENGGSHVCGGHGEIGWSKRIWLAFFGPSAVRSSCPYTGVIPVEALLQGRDDADMEALARNRVVFYGASLEGAQDKSFTPVNGLIANVFIHAMVLDNLITFHGHPLLNDVALGGVTVDANTVQMIAIAPVILILVWTHRRRIRRRHKASPHERSATIEYILEKTVQHAWHWFAFAIGLAVGLALTVAAGLSVANWIEVVFVSVEFAAMLLVGVPDSIWGYVHHVAGGIPQFQPGGEPEK